MSRDFVSLFFHDSNPSGPPQTLHFFLKINMEKKLNINSVKNHVFVLLTVYIHRTYYICQEIFHLFIIYFNSKYVEMPPQ